MTHSYTVTSAAWGLKALLAFVLFAGSAFAQESPSEDDEAPPALADDAVVMEEAPQEAPPPPPSADPAQAALDRKNGALAYDLFQQLQGTDPDRAAFGMAQARTLQGRYADALQLLADLPARSTPFQAEAVQLQGDLLLTLAEQAQLTGATKAAEEYLRQFEATGARNDRWLTRLQRTQGLLETPLETANLPPLRVALLLPLSGKLKDVGQDMLRASQLALFEQPLDSLQLVPEDTGDTPQAAQEALQRALSYGVDLILGPLTADAVEAVAPYARAAGRPVVAFSSDARVASAEVFLLSFIPGEQARLMARQALAQGKTKVAALVPDTQYGRDMLAAFKDELTAQGGTMATQILYNPREADLSPQLRRLVKLDEAEAKRKAEIATLEAEYKRLAKAMDAADLKRLRDLKKGKAEGIVGFDALFVPAPAEAMPLIAPQLAFYDIDSSKVLVLGTAQWTSPALMRNRGEYLRGAQFPAPDRAAEARFAKAFRAEFGRNPTPLAALAYDGVNLVSRLAQEGMTSGGRFQQAVLSSSFYGATGAFRFQDNGQTERAFELVTVAGGKQGVRQLQAAPVVLPPRLPSEQARSQTFFGGFFDSTFR
jgi:ABC-type branched-subunit amino acid transport system substrate-binding protein